MTNAPPQSWLGVCICGTDPGGLKFPAGERGTADAPPLHRRYTGIIYKGAAMSSAKELDLVMEQVGPALPGAENVTEIEDGVWAIGFDERTIVMLQLDDRGRLTLTLDVGRCLEAKRAAAYEALLTYNALWRETGGIRMALADGSVLQLFTATAAGLTVEALAAIVESFVEKALVWRDYLETSDYAAAPAQPAGMRV